MNLSFVELHGIPIFEQLKLEEALLRADTGNWCLIGRGTPPAIVMGISGKPQTLLNLPLVARDGVPVIKRFSGGGTVYVDEETLFVTFIMNENCSGIEPLPQPILKWSEEIYKPVFAHFDFALRENDYVIGKRKCGGNAQYIQKKRWLHHTSFLWNYTALKMDYLLLPEKRPSYRQDRSHGDFLCSLSPYFESPCAIIKGIKEVLAKRFEIQNVELEAIKSILIKPHRKATVVLEQIFV